MPSFIERLGLGSGEPAIALGQLEQVLGREMQEAFALLPHPVFCLKQIDYHLCSFNRLGSCVFARCHDCPLAWPV